MKNKLIKYGVWTFWTIFAGGLFYLFLEVRRLEKESEDLCDRGHGQTILKGRVLDFYTKKPIDSVQIRIVWSSSWDLFLDTLVKQNDSLSFTFNAFDDCESFFFTLSNKHYWMDYEQDYEYHPVYNASIDKGVINNFEIHLKPATFFRINVRRDTPDNTRDTVVFQIKKAHTDDWNLDRISAGYVVIDSGTQRTILAYHDIESNVNYDVRWTRWGTKNPDTLYYHFTAKPFDTVELVYKFQKL